MSTNGEAVNKQYIREVEDNLNPIESFGKKFYVGLAGLIALFSVAVAVQSTIDVSLAKGFEALLLTLAISLVVVLAASAVGALLGFLFGIPRSLQKSGSDTVVAPTAMQSGSASAAASSVAARMFNTNTSLEEISDWLTKIIIGLGLVQFQLLIDYLYRCALYAASFVAFERIETSKIGQLDYEPMLATPFYFALIVASLVAGCLFVYLETRTRLMLLFGGAEVANKERAREKQFEEAAVRPVEQPQPAVPSTAASGGAGKSPPTPAVANQATEADKAVAAIPRSEVQDPKMLLGWASAQARTGNLKEAEAAFLEVVQRTDDNSARERIVEVRRLRGDQYGAVKMKAELADKERNPKVRFDLLRSALYEALYIDKLEGAEEAIAISSKLLEFPEARDDPMLHLWRACAFAQKVKWLRAVNDKDPALKDARDGACEAIKTVVRLVPEYEKSERNLMRSLFEGDLPGEDDLKVFKDTNDTEIRELIYQGKPAAD